jgi:Putative transposase
MTLSLDEFLRRLLHLLPDGFVRIRHFGFLANRRRATLLPLCLRCSARHRRHSKTPRVFGTPVSFGSAPSVLDRWWSSKGLARPRYNFVLHLCSPLSHETNFTATKLCVLRHGPSLFASSPNQSLLQPSSETLLAKLFAAARRRAHRLTCYAPPHSFGAPPHQPITPFNLHRVRVCRKPRRLPSSR